MSGLERTNKAWQDWNALAKRAHEEGLTHSVRRLQPGQDAIWRTIERRSKELRGILEREADNNEED